MARKPTGEVFERRRGATVIYALRFRAYGRRRYLTLGTKAEGWTRARAEDELQNVLADVRRGIWQPPRPAAADPSEPTFHEFASEWFEAIKHEGLRESTLLDYEWQLTKHLLPYFAEHALSEITIAEVDRYRQLKVREGAISATSINKTIQRLAQILDIALERELIDRNTARGKRRRLKQRKPIRTTLDRAEQIEALISAARELDREARVDRRAIPRAALLSTLAFAGVRIGEALALHWRDVDLAGGRMRITDSKTDAGIRQIDLVPVLREELSVLKATTPYPAQDDFVFPTETGGQQNASNVRNRVMTLSIERANQRLEERGLVPAARRPDAALDAPHLHLAAARDRRGRALRDGPGRPRRPEGDALDLRAGDVPRRGGEGASRGPRQRPKSGFNGHWCPINALRRRNRAARKRRKPRR